jgi:hypothetical protein
MVHWHTLSVVNSNERLQLLLDGDTALDLGAVSELLLLAQYYQNMLYEGKTIDDETGDSG